MSDEEVTYRITDKGRLVLKLVELLGISFEDARDLADLVVSASAEHLAQLVEVLRGEHDGD